MGFKTYKELDRYLVLTHFMLKKKKSLPSKITLKDFGSGKYSKRGQKTDFKTV